MNLTSLSGNFFEDVGFDVLNLKDIGIDISSIPAELWNRKADRPVRLKRKILMSHAIDGSTAVKYKVAAPWAPVKTPAVIGLLQAFYSKKQDEDFVEDEEKPKGKPLKSKLLLKVAMSGRKKTTGPGDSSKSKAPVDPAKAAEKAAREAAKRKREADKQKSKEEKGREKEKRKKEKNKE
ncbi:hypothetical protein HDU96_002371 [Phlyctochytrium bullatum]|nr:hypothetical protein HDU96_002371 [Phlyctochytrium bullatum]